MKRQPTSRDNAGPLFTFIGWSQSCDPPTATLQTSCKMISENCAIDDFYRQKYSIEYGVLKRPVCGSGVAMFCSSLFYQQDRARGQSKTLWDR